MIKFGAKMTKKLPSKYPFNLEEVDFVISETYYS